MKTGQKKACLLLLAWAAVIMCLGSGALRAEEEPPAKVDLNTAAFGELLTLNNMNARKARRIIRFRAENGPFETLDDVLRVPGIGANFLELNKGRLTLGPAGD